MSISDKDLPDLYAGMFNVVNSPTSPWRYLDNWSKSDKGPHETLDKLNERMQNRWPGNYKIVAEPKWNGRNHYITEYEFKFKSPADKTWFKLQWSK